MSSFLALKTFTVYFSYAILILVGHISDFLHKILKGPIVPHKRGYAPMTRSFDGFYIRRLYGRIRDIFQITIASRPGAWFDVSVRKFVNGFQMLEYDGNVRHCINLASYNYLGFAENPQVVDDAVASSLRELGLSVAAPMTGGGYYSIVRELERAVAEFLDVEDALVIGQGFATNALVMPVLAPTPSTLVISDSLNHASIVAGARASRASIRVFRHNDPADLERVLRHAISRGQPRTHRPWDHIIVAVEGIYSMEGEPSPLHLIAPICWRYKTSIWLDEAHSIGAFGATGRGTTEFCGIPAREVAVMMGTFTKAFGAVGGYVAGSKKLISLLRHHAVAANHAESMPPAIAAQALGALRYIQTDDGRKRIEQLAANSHYFRRELLKRRHDVLGHPCSPVIPALLRDPAKMPGFGRVALRRGVATVCVGYPATPITDSRVRYCMSAAHTRTDLTAALEVLDDVGSLCGSRLLRVKKDEALMFWNEDGSPKIPPQYRELCEAYAAAVGANGQAPSCAPLLGNKTPMFPRPIHLVDG